MVFRRCAHAVVAADSRFAVNAEDCQPLGRLPTYQAPAAEHRDFDNVEFNAGAVPGANKNGRLKIGGRVCKTVYAPKAGSTLSDKEIQANYRCQIIRLGRADHQVRGYGYGPPNLLASAADWRDLRRKLREAFQHRTADTGGIQAALRQQFLA
jgi:hypothetical protein